MRSFSQSRPRSLKRGSSSRQSRSNSSSTRPRPYAVATDEVQALSWLAALAGMPAGAGGTFVSGGSAANLSALVTGRQVHQSRDPEPSYILRCFVLARLVRQFHGHARFDSEAMPLASIRARMKRSSAMIRSARRKLNRDIACNTRAAKELSRSQPATMASSGFKSITQ